MNCKWRRGAGARQRRAATNMPERQRRPCVFLSTISRLSVCYQDWYLFFVSLSRFLAIRTALCILITLGTDNSEYF